MVAVYDHWERLRREDLRISGLRTPSDLCLASSSSFSFSFSSSSQPRLSSFEFSGLLVGDLFSYRQILQATDSLSSKNLIKHGCNWDLFYGVLEGGTQVVVKKVDLSSVEKESYLRSELKSFNKVSHSRFVPLLGHCWENCSEKFLVYKYMPSKDLSSSLYREKFRPSLLLDWMTRLRIAIGATEGLCYLHHEFVPPLVHKNVEASSILLDANFEVRLGGLHEACVEKKRRNQSRISKLSRLPNSETSGIQLHVELMVKVNQRALCDFALPNITSSQTSLTRPPINANNFEIKSSLIQMVQQNQFGRNATEDPNEHLSNFSEICDTIKYNGVTEDAIKLRLFPFSLRDKAKQWLNSLGLDTFIIWTELFRSFLNKYFPPGKMARLRMDITSFTQSDGKSLYETWERFNDLIRKCPHIF